MSSRLKDKDIENLLSILEDGDISEDDLEDEDDDEEMFYNNARDIFQDLVDEQDNVLDENDNNEECIEGCNEEPIIEEPTAPLQDIPGPSRQQEIPALEKRKLIWKIGSLACDDSKLVHEPIETEQEIADLDTPYRCFMHFMTQNFLQKIVDETNLYARQQNPSTSFTLTSADLKKFIGILLFMSVEHFPSVRSYWNEKFGYEPIKNAMPVNKFETIRSFLHFNDNEKHLQKEHPDHDRLHKIRPVIDHLNKAFLSVPLDQRLSLDEQMCTTKIHHFLKQYLPNKPHKWGYKLFVLCNLSGYAYNFEIYSGQVIDNNKPIDEPDLGITNNVVLRLTRVIPRMKNHILFFDNFYTSLPLVYHLEKLGIHCVGTVQQNRLPNCRLPDKKSLMKSNVPRGTYEERVSHHDGVDFSVVIWKDNKVVTLLSTYVGAQPVGKVPRYDKVLKQKVDIDCPRVTKEYNMHMGGVDLMDSYLGRYRIRVKSKKWYMRLFYHLLDLAVINSWVLMKRNCTAKQVPKKMLPNLGQFRNSLADTLCNIGHSNGSKRGRPSTSSLESAIQAKKQKGHTHPLPSKDVRLDGTEHWPEFANRLRCKLPNCTGTTQWSCSKCNVPLCLNARNNCFKIFHNL